VTALLVLLDVDGTLFLTDDPLAGTALRETLGEDFGLELPADAMERVDHRGQTALAIARLVLHEAGVEEAQLGAGASTSGRGTSSSSPAPTRATGKPPRERTTRWSA
jgi:beta-phosphoglucomutase-like phosphatase (HAD superfamily)